jgi:dethiobiotin synthetase
LTAESIERRGLALRGWIANSIDPGFLRLAENVASLHSRLRAPCLGFFPFEPQASPESVAGGLSVDALQGAAEIS